MLESLNMTQFLVCKTEFIAVWNMIVVMIIVKTGINNQVKDFFRKCGTRMKIQRVFSTSSPVTPE